MRNAASHIVGNRNIPLYEGQTEDVSCAGRNRLPFDFLRIWLYSLTELQPGRLGLFPSRTGDRAGSSGWAVDGLIQRVSQAVIAGDVR